MPKLQEFLDRAAGSPLNNQTSRGFLLREDFRPYADLDGAAAREFLEANGYEVIMSGDMGTNGIAITRCGWILSTNGFLAYSPDNIDGYVSRMTKEAV